MTFRRSYWTALVSGIGLIGTLTVAQTKEERLTLALDDGRYDEVESLIRGGVDVNMSYHGKPLLLFFVESGDDVMAVLCIEKGANTNIKDQYGYPLIGGAVQNQRLSKTIEILLDRTPTTENERSDYLMMAAESGQSEAVRMLMKRGANVNFQDTTGYTALHWASLHAYPDIVRMLLDGGADRTIKTRNGSTALDVAEIYQESHGTDAIVKLLREYQPGKKRKR